MENFEMQIEVLDRQSGKKEFERVYGGAFLKLLYGNGPFEKVLSFFLLPLIALVPLASHIYGCVQKSRLSRRKVLPFIRKFHVEASEFEKKPEAFSSFNDFFIRRLKPECRPISASHAVLPADGRYRVYPKINEIQELHVKGKPFSLQELVGDDKLAKLYRDGSLVIARLCPVDYHRFHFPCEGVPGAPREISGPLYSVNPIALKKNLRILCKNKRVLTEIETDHFGKLLFIEVGATYVGGIKQTFSPHEPCKKGEEKGYFEFGGSCLLLLFEKGKIAFEKDLIGKKLEVKALFGQPLGVQSR